MKKWGKWAGGIGLFLAGVVAAVLFQYGNGPSERLAMAKYQAIRPGMTAKDVRSLFRDGHISFSNINTADVFMIDGTFFLTVKYEPNPSRPVTAKWREDGPAEDDWLVKSSWIYDVRPSSRFEDTLIHVGILKQRLHAINFEKPSGR